MKYVAALILLSSLNTYAFDLIETDEVSVQYKSFKSGSRDPLFWDSHPNQELTLKVNTTFLKYFFWNNEVHGATDENQFHTVGWHYQVGLRPFSWLDVQMEHHSQHILDNAYPYGGFPVQDSLGVTIYLVGGKDRRKALIP